MTNQKDPALDDLLSMFPCNRIPGTSRCEKKKSHGTCPGCYTKGCSSRQSLLFSTAVKGVHREMLAVALQG